MSFDDNPGPDVIFKIFMSLHKIVFDLIHKMSQVIHVPCIVYLIWI
jgi:hypothetical protein